LYTDSNNASLHLTYWDLNNHHSEKRSLSLLVGRNQHGNWIPLENVVGSETLRIQRISIDPDFKHLRQKDLDTIRAIRKANGKLKVRTKLAKGVTWTGIVKMEKKEAEKDKFIHTIRVYFPGM
jgi:hypothetical protein